MENQRYIAPPPTQTDVVRHLESCAKDDLCEASRMSRFFLTHTEPLRSFFLVEVKTFEALSHRLRHQFRNDKGFKDTQILLKTLKIFLDMNLEKIVRDFHSHLPLSVDVQKKSADKLYLPTRQMSEFVLVRLHGSFVLLEKLIVYCRLAGDMANKRVRLGHFWTVALNSLAIISRIWTLSKSQMFLIDLLHRSLVQIRKVLPDAKFPFLDETKYKVPQSLKDEVITEMGLKAELEKISFVDIPPHRTSNSQLTASKNEFGSPDMGVAIQRNGFNQKSDNFQLKTDEKKDSKCNRTSPLNGIKFQKEKKEVEKINSEIKSTDQKEQQLPCSKKMWLRVQETFDSLNELKDLKEFAETETAKRKSDRKNCVTKKLDQSQWKELKLHILKGDKNLEKRKALQKFKQRLKAWIFFPDSKGQYPENFSIS